jgi:hypothetical protein
VTRITLCRFAILLRASLAVGINVRSCDQNDALMDAAGERQGMKKLAAAISVGVAALAATWVAYCPSAVADTACPYDMSSAAGQKALVDATVAASNQVSRDAASIVGTTGNQALADRDRQIQADNTAVILACSGKASPASSQAIANADQMVANDEAAARQQAAERAAMNAPPPSGPVGIDCAAMNDSIGMNDFGPPGIYLNAVADRASGGLLGKIQAAPLAVCGAANLGLGAVAPNDFNRSQADTGFCDAANSVVNPIPDANPCGNTPAG